MSSLCAITVYLLMDVLLARDYGPPDFTREGIRIVNRSIHRAQPKRYLTRKGATILTAPLQVHEQFPADRVLAMERSLLKDYDARIMPPTVGPLHVYMKPLLYALLSIHWIDPRLKWNATDYNNVSRIYLPIKSVWRPDILVENMVDMFYPPRFQPPMLVQVYSTGNVTWNYPASISTLCQLDLQRFPYDMQTCKLNFISWMVDGTAMLLRPVIDQFVTDSYEEDDEWTLVNTSAKVSLVYYDCCPNPYSVVAYTITYQRDPHFYIIYLVMPAYILCILSVIGLFSASTSGPERLERVTLGITSMLTMSVFLTMVAQQIPKISSYVPSIGKFFLSQVLLLAIATVTAVMIMHVERRQLRDGRVPGCLRWLLKWPPIPPVRTGRKKENGTPHNTHTANNDHVFAAPRTRRLSRTGSGIGAVLNDLFGTEPQQGESREENASEWHFLAGRLDTYAMIFYIAMVNILTLAYLDIRYI